MPEADRRSDTTAPGRSAPPRRRRQKHGGEYLVHHRRRHADDDAVRRPDGVEPASHVPRPHRQVLSNPDRRPGADGADQDARLRCPSRLSVCRFCSSVLPPSPAISCSTASCSRPNWSGRNCRGFRRWPASLACSRGRRSRTLPRGSPSYAWSAASWR